MANKNNNRRQKNLYILITLVVLFSLFLGFEIYSRREDVKLLIEIGKYYSSFIVSPLTEEEKRILRAEGDVTDLGIRKAFKDVIESEDIKAAIEKHVPTENRTAVRGLMVADAKIYERILKDPENPELSDLWFESGELMGCMWKLQYDTDSTTLIDLYMSKMKTPLVRKAELVSCSVGKRFQIVESKNYTLETCNRIGINGLK